MNLFNRLLRSGTGVFLLLTLSAIAALVLSGCNHESGSAGPDRLYTCGMHPQILQNKPGNCPICGMKLTPVRKSPGAVGSNAPSADGTAAADASAAIITIDAVTSQNMDIRTGIVSRGPLRRVIRTVGVVDFDETALAEVSTKFRGWVEKLYVDSTGKQMHQGEPLFEIYSPELYLAQTEFLLTQGALTNQLGPEAGLRAAAANTKLRYWDISEDQIAELARTRQPKKTLRVNAPRDGTVVEKMVVEGQMVEAGMKLYRLADLATVWVHAQVYEQDLALVQLGQEAVVSLSSQPDPKFRGRVTYIYPTVEEKTRTAKVRMEFHNPGYFLKPGMYATVQLAPELSPSALLVPDMAVLRSGEKNTVFVALDGGHFEPRMVTLGARAEGGMYQVVSGLEEGERVVTSGQFMLDSESQLREAIQKMVRPNAPAPAMEQSGRPSNSVPSTATALHAASADLTAAYICPMPEHVSLEYDHPGKCPICGMALVPVTRDMLARIQPGGQLEYYTCPMPEHSDIREAKAGKCPRCGMTLIPVMVRPKAVPEPAAKPAPEQTSGSTKLYTCPMAQHADVVSDAPGVCPKCEMKLVETSTVRHGKIAEEHWHKQPAKSASPPAAPSPAHSH